jgi:large-conductance mechanosensitive channel
MADTKPRIVKPDEGETVIIDKHGKPHHGVAVLLNTDDVVRHQFGGFLGFLRERTVVTIAISFLVATQVQAVMNQLIKSFLDPLTDLLFGTKLSADTFTVTYHGRTSTFAWGAFVYQLISFFVIIFTIYVIIKLLRLDKFDKKQEPKK